MPIPQCLSSFLCRGFLSGSEDKQLCWEVICLLLDASLELLQGSGGVTMGSGLLLGMQSCLLFKFYDN